jgi:hypothetical protein
MNWKKVIISGLVAGVVILVVGMLTGSLFSVDYSKTPELWKEMTGNWYYQMWAVDFVEGIIYAMVFTVLYNSIPGKGWKKGLNYGIILWLVGTVPGMMLTYLTMAVPDMIVASWTFGGLISLVIAGSAMALVHDKIK